MNLTAKESKELIVKKSRNGNGIFTKKNFLPGQTVFQVRGVFVSGEVDDDIEDEVRSNTYRYDKNRYISPQGTIGDFLNHSCEPNAAVVKKDTKLFVVAIEFISKGKEVFIDYSTITAADDIWTMHCNCGTKSCRNVIKRFNTLPKKLQEYYKELRIVPTHVLRIKNS